MNEKQIAEFLAFAQRLADAAGEVIRPFFRQRIDIEAKIDPEKPYFDPVTEADRKAEEIIRRLIEETYPEHGIVGEELGEAPKDDLTWYIDPIDGTRGFIAGFPLWGTLIALAEGGAPVIGIIDQSYIGERFVGWPGGAELRTRFGTRPLRTRKEATLADAVLSATDPQMFLKREEMEAFERVRARTRLTRYSADCYAYGLLALGFVDVVVETLNRAYDVQAPIAVIENAGGIATNWTGGPAHQGGPIVAAANAGLHAAVLELINAGR